MATPNDSSATDPAVSPPHATDIVRPAWVTDRTKPIVLPPGIEGIAAGQLVAEAQDLTYTVEKLLPESSVVVVAGPAKTGMKSLTMMDIGRAVAEGKAFCGLATSQRQVIYVFLEDGRRRVARRLKALGVELQSGMPFTCCCISGAEVQKLIDFLKTVTEPILLIIDPFIILQGALSVRTENAANEIEKAFADLRVFAQRTNSTVVIVHHFKKNGEGMRGSSAINGSSDGWIEIFPLGDGVRRLVWVLRDAEDGEMAIRFTNESGGFRFEPTEPPPKPGPDADDVESRIKNVLGLDPTVGWTQAKLMERLGLGREPIRKALDSLEARHLAARPQGPKSGYFAGPALTST